jgi:signal transduction histidine kinase
MKIRTYLLLMAVAILGPVMFFAAIALSLLLDSGRASALRGIDETARATALMVDRELLAAEAALHALATSPSLAAGDMRRFHEQAVAAGRGPNSWTVLLAADGRQLVNTVRPFGDPLGVASSLDRIDTVLRTHRTVVSDLQVGSVTKRYVVTLDVPAVTPDGRGHVLAAAFATPYFNALFAQQPAPAGWAVGIIDREGKFIARNLDAARWVGRAAIPELVAAARRTHEGRIRHATLEGVDAYIAYTHTAISGWTVAVGAPVALIEGQARKAIAVAFLGLLAAAVCAAVVAVVFTRRLVDAINGAADAAVSFAHGERASGQSEVVEVQRLHAALGEAGKLLEGERASRLQAESERLRLLESEQAARGIVEAQYQAKDQFLAMLGHEIRNPLSAIAGASGIIGMEADGNERVTRAREVLERQSGNLAAIVDELLDVTRVTNGRIMLNAEHLDLAMVVIGCLDGLRASGRCGRHEINVTSAAAWVYADRTRLEQIVDNLLFNALKYTPQDGSIDVAVYPEGRDAVLAVRDSGVGISPEMLPRVFDLFMRGADAPLRKQGAGLTLVRQLVQLHGGTVEASSAGTGKGSRFTVRLPLSQPDGAHAPDAAPASAGGPVRVLLIEDNLDARAMLAMGLGMHGHTVYEAGEGHAGIELALDRNPDVAVIDIGLPGMTGLEVASALKRDIRTQHIRLIALTGYGQDADRQRALDAASPASA